MAKSIKYQYLAAEVNLGTEDSPKIKQIYSEKTIAWSAENEAIAKAEAKDGLYTVEDDGTPAPAPDRLDQIDAQVTYTAMMTGTLMDGGGRK